MAGPLQSEVAGGAASLVRVREILTGQRWTLPGETAMMRVPYDVIATDGPVRIDGNQMIYRKQGEDQLLVGRVRAAELGSAHPGERVLLSQLVGLVREGAWWICEVEAIDGDEWD